MGIEIFQFALPVNSLAISGCTTGGLNGEILQTIGHLIAGLNDGERGDEFIDELGDYYSPDDKGAIAQAFEVIQDSPHLLAINFDGASRGHEHWAFFLNWEPAQ